MAELARNISDLKAAEETPAASEAQSQLAQDAAGSDTDD